MKRCAPLDTATAAAAAADDDDDDDDDARHALPARGLAPPPRKRGRVATECPGCSRVFSSSRAWRGHYRWCTGLARDKRKRLHRACPKPTVSRAEKNAASAAAVAAWVPPPLDLQVLRPQTARAQVKLAPSSPETTPANSSGDEFRDFSPACSPRPLTPPTAAGTGLGRAAETGVFDAASTSTATSLSLPTLPSIRSTVCVCGLSFVEPELLMKHRTSHIQRCPHAKEALRVLQTASQTIVGRYTTQRNNETCLGIAKKLAIVACSSSGPKRVPAVQLVSLNKDRYPKLNTRSRLQVGTILYVPMTATQFDGQHPGCVRFEPIRQETLRVEDEEARRKEETERCAAIREASSSEDESSSSEDEDEVESSSSEGEDEDDAADITLPPVPAFAGNLADAVFPHCIGDVVEAYWAPEKKWFGATVTQVPKRANDNQFEVYFHVDQLLGYVAPRHVRLPKHRRSPIAVASALRPGEAEELDELSNFLEAWVKGSTAADQVDYWTDRLEAIGDVSQHALRVLPPAAAHALRPPNDEGYVSCHPTVCPDGTVTCRCCTKVFKHRKAWAGHRGGRQKKLRKRAANAGSAAPPVVLPTPLVALPPAPYSLAATDGASFGASGDSTAAFAIAGGGFSTLPASAQTPCSLTFLERARSDLREAYPVLMSELLHQVELASNAGDITGVEITPEIAAYLTRDYLADSSEAESVSRVQDLPTGSVVLAVPHAHVQPIVYRGNKTRTC